METTILSLLFLVSMGMLFQSLLIRRLQRRVKMLEEMQAEMFPSVFKYPNCP